MKKYVVVNSNGFYFDGYFTDTSCGWTAFENSAEQYETSQAAAGMARKINRAYGRKVCRTAKYDGCAY